MTIQLPILLLLLLLLGSPSLPLTCSVDDSHNVSSALMRYFWGWCTLLRSLGSQPSMAQNTL